jgi:hypothetical protein
VKVDKPNHTTLGTMLDHASGEWARQEVRLPDIEVDTDAVGDTGATVCCSGPSSMQRMGLGVSDLLPTSMTLFDVNNKNLMVQGAVPVMITAQT